MIDELAKRIWSRSQFHAEAQTLRTHLLRKRYDSSQIASYDEDLLGRLLRSAAILAASRSIQHRQMAYNIATAAADIEWPGLGGIPYVLLLVLSRVGNFPSLMYAKARFGVSEDSLPIRLVTESEERKAANSVIVDGQCVSLTDFQYLLWNKLRSGDAVGISAPTSAGKSYVLQAYAKKLLLAQDVNNVAFLVPTRALINQVADEVSEWVNASDLDIEIITTPVDRNVSLPTRAIYVITQERMQLLQAGHTNLSFEVMLVDEIQSIADGPRGILLSSVIDEALSRNSQMQLVLAGPNIRNPGSVTRLFNTEPSAVQTDEAAVSQNIIFVDCDQENPCAAKLSFLSEQDKISLGAIECDQPLLDHRSKLINLPLRLARGGQSLIYALGPAECENIAFGLSDDEVEVGHPGLHDLSAFIKEAVHPKYQLAHDVLQGVGFHYGRLPALVRKAIEDAFSDGRLQFLVTTSTLLYGVNLPAQNLFLHNPHKGQNQPISAPDFWNLAGRAGRLGKEFAGNIFLIDYGGWQSQPLTGPKELDVTPSLTDHVVDRVQELTEYIENPDSVPDRKKPDEFENTFVKLVRDHIEGRLGDTLNRAGLPVDDPNRLRLVEAVAASAENTNIGKETLFASPTVSIYRQQSLYDRLNVSLKKHGPAYVIPKFPMHANAYQSYMASMKRCHDEILKFPKGDRSHAYFAQLALKWMKGEPLPKIIDASYDYKLRHGLSPNWATVIRETLNEVERDIRFNYVRMFSCYNAVLELVLRDNGLGDLVSSIPSVPMYLEVGACSPTMVAFMGLGLSRYTAGKLQGISRQTDMSQIEARAWISRQNLELLDVPMASVHEISRLVGGS